MDTLSQLISLANIRSNGRVLVYEDLGGLLLGALAERQALPVSIHRRTGIAHQIAYKFNLPQDTIVSVSFCDLDYAGFLPDPLKPYILGSNIADGSKKPVPDPSEPKESNSEHVDGNVDGNVDDQCYPLIKTASQSDGPLTVLDASSFDHEEAFDGAKCKRIRISNVKRQDKRHLKNLKIQELFNKSNDVRPFDSLILAISPSDFQHHSISEFIKLTINCFSEIVEPSGSIVIYSQFKEVLWCVHIIFRFCFPYLIGLSPMKIL